MAHRSRIGLGALVAIAGGCASDGRTLRDPVFDLPAPPATTVPAVTTSPPTAAPAPATIDAGSGEAAGDRPTVVIDLLDSPANATARAVGVGALPGDAITVDDEPADVIAFDVADDGRFTATVWIPDEGAHTVCVAHTCGRVFTLAPDALTPEEVVAQIDEAQTIVATDYDVADVVPGWTVEVGGALAGTGGSTDVERRTITIYRNRGRTVDEYVRTILHEYGHAADFDLLDDAERLDYRAIRGFAPDLPWRDGEDHGLDAWARQPSEDFAEALVMLWSDGRWVPRTDALGPPPDEAQLAAIAELIAD